MRVVFIKATISTADLPESSNFTLQKSISSFCKILRIHYLKVLAILVIFTCLISDFELFGLIMLSGNQTVFSKVKTFVNKKPS